MKDMIRGSSRSYAALFATSSLSPPGWFHLTSGVPLAEDYYSRNSFSLARRGSRWSSAPNLDGNSWTDYNESEFKINKNS